MLTHCWFILLDLPFVLEILKKSSENDQLTGHFTAFFLYFCFVSKPLI